MYYSLDFRSAEYSHTKYFFWHPCLKIQVFFEAVVSVAKKYTLWSCVKLALWNVQRLVVSPCWLTLMSWQYKRAESKRFAVSGAQTVTDTGTCLYIASCCYTIEPKLSWIWPFKIHFSFRVYCRIVTKNVICKDRGRRRRARFSGLMIIEEELSFHQ